MLQPGSGFVALREKGLFARATGTERAIPVGVGFFSTCPIPISSGGLVVKGEFLTHKLD